VGDLKKENDGMIMQYYEEALTILLQTTPWYVIPADDKEMCRYIVGKIIWEEMQTLIFKRLKWMIIEKKHRIVQRDAGKRIKKCSNSGHFF
jgi:hypothetical protein